MAIPFYLDRQNAETEAQRLANLAGFPMEVTIEKRRGFWGFTIKRLDAHSVQHPLDTFLPKDQK